MVLDASTDMTQGPALARLGKVASLTLVLVYLVILAGSVVRSSGAGMGCPDWPKCFGKLVPPTSASELPPNYREIYAGEHNAVEEFNAVKTWTEYINRLFGALLGFSILIQLILAVPFAKKDKALFWGTFAAFILILFQAWLGAKVVSSALAPVKITTHMLAALLILAVGASLWHRIRHQQTAKSFALPSSLRLSLYLALGLSIVQVLVGTQVREEVDVLLDTVGREGVLEGLSLGLFNAHRALALLTVLVNGYLFHQVYNEAPADVYLRFWVKALLWVIMGAVLSGIILNRFDLPAFAQPVHLLLSCLMFGSQYMLLLHVRSHTTPKLEPVLV